MHIKRLLVNGFKRFEAFELELDPTFNVIVGDNEAGKSTLLEAIALAVTGKYDGRLVQYVIDPYMFNAQRVSNFFERRRSGEQAEPPRVEIEAYLEDDGTPQLARLKGTRNSKGENCPGLSMVIEVDDIYADALKEYAADDSNPSILPVEFYISRWSSFDGNGTTLRHLPFRAALIDGSLHRIYRGPNAYLTQTVKDILNDNQRRKLALEYKKLHHQFAQAEEVVKVNEHLEQQGNPATSKKLELQMDMSTRSSWDKAIAAHLDDMPFDCVGKGEQCRVQTRLAIAGEDRADILLIEEPENHLSHANLNGFLKDIRKDCSDRQVIVTTHSTFVLNKLGLNTLKLLGGNGRSAASLTDLTPETKDYFMKLPGHDTLRLVLARRSILVEGPSDELVVQRAYKEANGKLPIEDGVDVISVRSLAFKRFLEIAHPLQLQVRVITDNDGSVENLKTKYAQYLNNQSPSIKLFWDADETCPTLEPQLLRYNNRSTLNDIFGTTCESDEDLRKHMKEHKTECALKLFETTILWRPPEYIANAVTA